MFPPVLSLIGFEIESGKKLMVGPPTIVDLGFDFAVIHDVSYDSLFTVLESDCKVFDLGPCVQRVLIGSDCGVKSDAAIFVEEKGEILFVVEGHDVERATLILKNQHRYEIYPRNIRDKLRVDTEPASPKPRRQQEWCS